MNLLNNLINIISNEYNFVIEALQYAPSSIIFGALIIAIFASIVCAVAACELRDSINERDGRGWESKAMLVVFYPVALIGLPSVLIFKE